MSNGTFEVKSADITGLYKTIVGANPAGQHYTMDCGGFAAIVTKRGQKSILFYNFNRSIKPLARIPEGGEVVIMRDYFTEKELMDYLVKLVYLTKPLLHLSVKEHTHQGMGDFYRETVSDDAPSLNIDFKDGVKIAEGAVGILRANGMLPEPNLSDVLDQTNKIARECGIPVPPRPARHPKVCDPHRD